MPDRTRQLGQVRRMGQMWRYFGPEWLVYRLAYAARIRAGLVQRSTPVRSWDAQPLRALLAEPRLADPEAYLRYRRAESPPFFFEPSSRHDYSEQLAAWDTSDSGGKTPVETSRELAGGKLRYFAHTLLPTGFPPDWHANPFTGERIRADVHWSRIGDFDAGDIKAVWEPSRFGFVYPLVRAYWRTGDERYASLFWQAVESWRSDNPPQQGPNWMCGQETSLRVMAWCFGLYGFLDAQVTSAPRVAGLAQMIALSGERIYANRSYALHQRNNHGVSEGMGLWTIGTLFPELRNSTIWQREGRRMLEIEGRELIYEDGSFSQHSVNYQRMILQVYTWTLRLGELSGRLFSSELRRKVGLAGRFLYNLQDETSGRLPNYGHNDGSLVLPLDNCDYLDFRPVIQAAHYLTERTRLYGEGPWDEDLLWLFGSDALPTKDEEPALSPAKGRKTKDERRRTMVVGRPSSFVAERSGGYYTLRSDTGLAFVRCAIYKDRPSQADMLHVDLWWRGQNIALDPGTYSYNAPPPMDLALAGTAYHNTVTVDERDQMEKVGRFLWLPWTNGTVRARRVSAGGRIAYWEGTHDGYERLQPPVSHRRAIVRLGGEHWLVLDKLDSSARHNYRLHWLLQDAPYSWDAGTAPGAECLQLEVLLETPAGPYKVLASSPECSASTHFSVVRADESSARGWQSLYYLQRSPAVSVEVTQENNAALFWTLFGPAPVEAAIRDGRITVQGADWQAVVQLGEGNGHASTLASRVTLESESAKETLLISEHSG